METAEAPVFFQDAKHPEALAADQLAVGMRVAHQGMYWPRQLGTIVALTDEKVTIVYDSIPDFRNEMYLSDVGAARYREPLVGWNATNRLTRPRDVEH